MSTGTDAGTVYAEFGGPYYGMNGEFARQF